MKPSEPIAITGVGVVHALGRGAAFGEALAAGSVGVAPLERHPTLAAHDSQARVFSWLEVPEPGLMAPDRAHLASRLAKLVLACAEDALGEGPRPAPARGAVIVGTGFGNLADLDPSYRKYHTEGKRRLSPLTVPVNMNNSPANLVSQLLGWEGPSSTVNAACASGLKAVLDACSLLQSGRADCVLAGGADLTICPTLIDAWDKMRVLSPETEPSRACRPLAVGRPGLVLSEGAALFRLERLSGLGGRPVLGLIRGGWENCDAFDLVAPRAETQTACVRGALQDAGMDAAQVDQVHLHATGTEKNDRQELEVLASVFGRRLSDLPLAAIKAQTGHTMGASGVLSLAAALHTHSSGHGYPVSCGQPDWDAPLTLSPPRPFRPQATLINCFAFGGTNVCLILSPQESP